MAMLKEDRLAKKKVNKLRELVDHEIRKESPALQAFLDRNERERGGSISEKDQALLLELNTRRWKALTGNRDSVVEMSPPLSRFIDLSTFQRMLWESNWMSDLDQRLPATASEPVTTPQGVTKWIE